MLLALRATCKAGDTIAVESPFYFNFLQMIAELGLKALEIPSTPREGISIEALRYAIEQNKISACLVITNFGNPLGSLMPDERKRELVELLAGHEIPLIEDDIYGDLGFANDRPSTAKSFDRSGLVIYCSSFSKTIAPGYRVGWAIAGRFQGRDGTVEDDDEYRHRLTDRNSPWPSFWPPAAMTITCAAFAASMPAISRRWPMPLSVISRPGPA